MSVKPPPRSLASDAGTFHREQRPGSKSPVAVGDDAGGVPVAGFCAQEAEGNKGQRRSESSSRRAGPPRRYQRGRGSTRRGGVGLQAAAVTEKLPTAPPPPNKLARRRAPRVTFGHARRAPPPPASPARVYPPPAPPPRRGGPAPPARTASTPPAGVWMTGYAVRTHPADGTAQTLWVKALALRFDPAGNRGVLLAPRSSAASRAKSPTASREENRPQARPAAQRGDDERLARTHCSPFIPGNIAGLRLLPPDGQRKPGLRALSPRR